MTTSLVSDADPFTLESKYRSPDGRLYLTGVQALVRVLLDQRRSDRRAGISSAGLVSGYPGSPLGGVDIELNRQRTILTEHDVVHIPGLNEDLAATALWGSQTVGTLPGAQVDGVFGMWFAKAPGVDRSGDAFRTANIRGTAAHGGVLVVAGDDPAARSTNYPTDSNGAFHDWSMPILFPGDVQEILDLGRHGYAMSRACGLWIGFKMVTDIADGSGTASVSDTAFDPVLPAVELDGRPFVPTLRVNEVGGALKAAEHDLRYGRLKLAEDYIRLNELNPVVVDSGDARLGIVAPGKAYFDLMKAFERLGIDDHSLAEAGIRVKKVSALFPISDIEWAEFASGLSEVIVVEEKRPFLERFLKESLYQVEDRPTVIGKRDERAMPFLPEDGELNASIIARTLGPRLSERWGLSIVEPNRSSGPRERKLIPLATTRTPYFCSGCPHNRSLIVPDGSVVGAGIGCHIMELVVPRDEYGTLSGFTQMGAEGAQWVGMAPFTDIDHIFQNVGDGTFHHSGSLALRFAVANDVNITFKLLYNGTVGMTGGQDVAGAMAVPELTQLLAAEGVRRTLITTDDPKRYRGVRLAAGVDVWHRDRLIEAQEELAATSGVTVLIHDQYCAAEKRRLRKRSKMATPDLRVHIDERVCEGCGDCGQKSQCLSVQPVDTPFGRKTQIDQTTCNFDYSCLLGDCPSFITVDTSDVAVRRTRWDEPPADLPSPTSRVSTDRCNLHMTGIGGTGVVTMSQILATAAMLDGFNVRDLDHTGSSQKAGPVVSQLQIWTSGSEPAAAIAPGEADVLLAFDMLGAVTESNVDVLGLGRTKVVGSTSRTPTGQMAVQPALRYPSDTELIAEVDELTGDANVYIDAQAVAIAVFDSAMLANTVLLGAAVQAGVVPMSLDSVREAVRLNGAAIDRNLAALEWGRAAVARPDAIPSSDQGRPSEMSNWGRFDRRRIEEVGLPDVVEVLCATVPDLVGYGNEKYASDYMDVVETAVRAERGLSGGEVGYAVAVARGLHKLMAYKDEYEVARLLVASSSRTEIERRFGTGAKASWNFHPPVLRSLGVKRKLRLGPWFRPALRALAAAKPLRGTVLDVFGHAEVRRVERELIDHYRRLIGEASAQLEFDPEACVELAELPDLVRGYEHVKLDNVARYLDRADQLCDRLGLRSAAGPALRSIDAASVSAAKDEA